MPRNKVKSVDNIHDINDLVEEMKDIVNGSTETKDKDDDIDKKF